MMEKFNRDKYKDMPLLVDLSKLKVHEQLKIKRIYDGLTQTQLVNMLEGTSVSTLSRIEKGIATIPFHIEERIYKYLYEDGSAQ